LSLPKFKIDALEGGRFVVRDDVLPGGTKRRALDVLLEAEAEHVYAGPAYGYAQVALAYAARDHGARATVFVAKRDQPTELSLEAKRAGAQVVQIPFGRLSNVRAKARAYCERTGARLLPFGLNDPRFIGRLAELARAVRLGREPVGKRQVWCAAGSGTLTRALQEAFPEAEHVAVVVGTEAGDVGRARVLRAAERFEEPAQEPPPFPSAEHYDAKVWRFFREQAAPAALFWNVGR
jgi:hypothetical protein